MTTDQRARLDLGGLADEPKTPARVDPAMVRETSEQAGFGESAAPVRRSPKIRRTRDPKPEEPVVRRGSRLRTGRVHQFATRLDASTLNAIYEYGDRESITLSEVIEHAMAALLASGKRSEIRNSDS